jgi:hypothetical protein
MNDLPLTRHERVPIVRSVSLLLSYVRLEVSMDLQKPLPAIPQNATRSYDSRLLNVREADWPQREKVPLQEHYSAVIPARRIARSRKTGLPKSYSWLPGVKMSGRTVLVSIRNAGHPGRGSTSRMETACRRHGPVATRRVIGMGAGPVGSGLLLSISGLH